MTERKRGHFIIGNAVGVTMGESAGEKILSAALASDPDFAIVVEADDIAARNGAPIRGAENYRLFHRPNHSDKDGTLIAVRRDHVIVGEPLWTLCTPDRLGRRKFDINPRWALTVNVRFDGEGSPRKITGVHFPPPDTSALIPLAHKAMHKLDDDLFAGDLNLSIEAIRREYPSMDCRGQEVLHAVAKPSMHLGSARAVKLAMSDHPGVRIPFRK